MYSMLVDLSKKAANGSSVFLAGTGKNHTTQLTFNGLRVHGPTQHSLIRELLPCSRAVLHSAS